MPGNIVIVDDTASALKLLKDILTAEGYKARPFNNGELALRSLTAESPELILLDIRMPVMDGFEVCRRIKEDERLRDIPIIFISAATDTEDKVRAFLAGGIDYITKPFQKEEVIARVQTHVALYRSKRNLMLAEKALRKNEQSLKIAQAVAHLGHWEMDLQIGDQAWSDETYRILGFEPQAIAPSYNAFLKSVHPDDREGVVRHIDNIRKGGEFDIEYRIILPDGRVRVVHAKGVLVASGGPDKRLSIIGTVQPVEEMIGVIQDITERKETEEALVKAKEVAETTTKLKDKFISIVAHDLKSPLSGIVGLLEYVLRENAISEKTTAILGVLIKSAKHLESVINELLNITKLQTGSKKRDLREISPSIIVETCISKISSVAECKNIRVKNEIPPEVKITTDPTLLEMALSNLISNAIKFSYEGKDVRVFMAHGEKTAIGVEDKGVGIEEKMIPRLFRFEEKTTTRGTAGEVGTGFGLPLCAEIMASLGGGLRLETEQGKGSVFYLELPATGDTAE